MGWKIGSCDSAAAIVGEQMALIYQSLTLDGATPVSEVNRNMNVDGSTTPKRFKIQPPPGQIWQLTRIIFMMRDDGSFDSGGWGNNGGTPLDNGVSIGLTIKGTDYDKSVVPWKTVADLGAIAHDLTHHNFGQGAEFLTMRLTFSKAGQNIRLVGDDGDNLWMDISDDLQYLLEQRAMAQGFVENVYL